MNEKMKYPWPSSVNFSEYVTVMPWINHRGEMNFSTWREQMVSLLEGQDVMGFVDGEIVQPPGDGDELKQWRRTDRLVKGWILGSLSKDVLDAMPKRETAREVWLEVHKIFHWNEAGQPLRNTSGKVSSMYLALYKAAWKGEWQTAQKLFQENKVDATAIISSYNETALHIAVLKVNSNDFVKKMVELLPRDALALKDSYGKTALHNAAIVGNTKAAMDLVSKNPDLLYISNNHDKLPVWFAARNKKRETLKHLIKISERHGDNRPIFQGKSGIHLLGAVINSRFFDVTMELVSKHPHLARLYEKGGYCALSTIAVMSSEFPSGERFNWWQKFIYNCIPQKQSKCKASAAGDVENGGFEINVPGFHWNMDQKLECIIWKVMEYIVPGVKKMREQRARQDQALELVKLLCQEMASLPEEEASPMFLQSIIAAAENGISEIVEEIMDAYPLVTFARNAERRHVFHLAARNRFENVINIMYRSRDLNYEIYNESDNHGNNLMHMCGKLAPPDRLNLVPGAALQMQRELQWFKKMKETVHPSLRTLKNQDGQTPKMVFTEEHKELKAEGEKWMKETATACNIAAALIATVMFAAAFTLPKGDDSFAFNLFVVSDAISLFTSVTSLLMFLSILTSRYAEKDFLFDLPSRLVLGLLSLFVSIMFMLAAFCATMYLIFRDKLPWILIPVAAFACLPVTAFVLLKFPLLLTVVASTYGRGIFHTKNRSPVASVSNP